RGALVRVALVGYTNVGKSTIMNLLSKSDVFAENKLFATLDTTVRKVVIESIPFLLSDTVGFIRKLPHDLIESFKSTLDEVREADVLIHVVDISHACFEDQINIVKQTLIDINVVNKPTLLVFNKIDVFENSAKDFDYTDGSEILTIEELNKTWMAKENIPCIFISAKNKTNIDTLKKILLKTVSEVHYKRYPNSFLINNENATNSQI
ncbi:MAG: GTPase, partial [Bacteroidales bacterium]